MEIDETHTVIRGVGDDKIARCSDENARRHEQARIGRRATIARKSRRAAACKRGDRSAGIDASNDMVARVSDEQVAERVERQAARVIQLSIDRRATVAR
ncbi:MAG TPA: hypothetical protein VGH34_18965, partial [Vicinamibacterales bacterium]